jgi:hypothetical protein
LGTDGGGEQEQGGEKRKQFVHGGLLGQSRFEWAILLRLFIASACLYYTRKIDFVKQFSHPCCMGLLFLSFYFC